jgi:hypothetical protein
MFCKQTPSLAITPFGFDIKGSSRKWEFTFDTSPFASNQPNTACVSTGVFLKTGTTYHVSVEREPGKENMWTFFSEASYMGGQPISRLPWYKELAMAALFPLRRTLDRPWGAIILRVGGMGNEEDFLDREPPPQSDALRANPKGFAVPDAESIGESLKPKRDGELFVYLNKPIWWVDRLIDNTGIAKVTISYTEK